MTCLLFNARCLTGKRFWVSDNQKEVVKRKLCKMGEHRRHSNRKQVFFPFAYMYFWVIFEMAVSFYFGVCEVTMRYCQGTIVAKLTLPTWFLQTFFLLFYSVQISEQSVWKITLFCFIKEPIVHPSKECHDLCASLSVSLYLMSNFVSMNGYILFKEA